MPQRFQAPPVRTPFYPQAGEQLPGSLSSLKWIFSWVWLNWFQSVSTQLTSPVSLDAPASAVAQGTPGMLATDGNFLYVCVAANSWKRVAINAW